MHKATEKIWRRCRESLLLSSKDAKRMLLAKQMRPSKEELSLRTEYTI
jgi:hypothetical protein